MKWEKKELVILLACFLILSISAFNLGNSLLVRKTSVTARAVKSIPSFGTIGYVYPYLSLQISPPGYPVAGEWWSFNVYEVEIDQSSDKPVFRPALNSTVKITLDSNGKTKNFEIPVDENGVASFQYLPEYSDVAFQAFGSNAVPSQKIILSQHYVSFIEMDAISAFTIVTSISSLASSSWLIHQRKIGGIQKWIVISFISLFSIIAIISLYSRLYQGTTWGYPENIFGSYFTFTLLKNIYFSGLVALATFIILSYVHYIHRIDSKNASK